MTVKIISPHFRITDSFRRVIASLLNIALDLPGLVTIHRGRQASASQQAEAPTEPETGTAEATDNNDDIYIIPVCPWW